MQHSNALYAAAYHKYVKIHRDSPSKDFMQNGELREEDWIEPAKFLRDSDDLGGTRGVREIWILEQ